MTVVVPPDDVVLVSTIDPHLLDLALPRLLADVKAVNDELVSNLGMHGDLLGSRPDRPPRGHLTGRAASHPGVGLMARWQPTTRPLG